MEIYFLFLIVPGFATVELTGLAGAGAPAAAPCVVWAIADVVNAKSDAVNSPPNRILEVATMKPSRNRISVVSG